MGWKKNYPIILFIVYLVIWGVLAIKPYYRSVWIDENILTVVFLGLLVVSYRWFRLSNTSYTFIFVFMVLHAIGGHYSYAEMPLFDTLKEMYGWSRNHYDRLVHFLFGFLFFIPVYECVVRIFKVEKGWRGLFVTFFIIAALKGMFELIEYGYVLVRDDPLNFTHYLGMQGDAWDSQKDVILGILGAGIMWVFVGIKNKFGRVLSFEV